MRTQSLVPRPNTTFIGLGTTLSAQELARLARSLPMVVVNVCEHHTGKALNSAAMMVSCQYNFLCRLQLVSHHVIEVQEIGFKKFGTELRRGWPPADFSWQCC